MVTESKLKSEALLLTIPSSIRAGGRVGAGRVTVLDNLDHPVPVTFVGDAVSPISENGLS
jgi:hypothetical protein